MQLKMSLTLRNETCSLQAQIYLAYQKMITYYGRAGEKVEKIRKSREALGSVNLRADEETKKYEEEIKKMEDDRADLYSAIVKLKSSIEELNQKGRERLWMLSLR